MTFWQSVSQFVAANSASIIISVLVGLIFFVLGPLGLWFSGRRIRRERIKKAKDAILDLLEGMLVNQEEVTPDKLKQLFSAIEREIDVSLGGAYDVDLLIEDVMLRFQRSKHLDAQQKQQYFAKLVDVRAAHHARQEVQPEVSLSRREQEIIAELRETTKDQEASRTLIDELQTRLERRPDLSDSFMAPFLVYGQILRKKPWLLLVFILMYLGVMFVLLLLKAFMKASI